ncbi:MAG: hypothetical protein AAF485_00775 [Chloroflexota bacterium]
MINLSATRPKPDRNQVVQIKQWVRESFELSEDTQVMVTELECTEEGCPPLETIIAILEGPGQTHQYKLHKALVEVVLSDVAALVKNN